MRNIGFIVGSLRKGAYTRMLSRALVELAPASFKLSEISIGELPLYNQDLDTATPPAQWVSFRDQVQASDAMLFITPEYNRGLPAALKNAIDVGSRPPKQSVWRGKPAATVSITPGKLGALSAHQQLRLSLSTVGMPVMPSPEINLPGAGTLFDAGGKLVDQEAKDRLTALLNDFDIWIGRFK